jgi:hypothetical protein
MIISGSEKGFVLVTALMMLVALTLLGLATIMTSTVELKIAGNDRLYKKTFYQADGGTETGTVLAYENALCINGGGFTAGGTPDQADIGLIRVSNLDFADPGQGTTDPPADPAGATPAVRDAVYYATMGDDSGPHTNFTINGISENTEGSGLQMDSGYPGLGQGSAGGGTHIRYAINSQRIGELGSRSDVTLQWRMSTHLINNASSFDCKY